MVLIRGASSFQGANIYAKLGLGSLIPRPICLCCFVALTIVHRSRRAGRPGFIRVMNDTRPSPFFAALPLPCITTNANQRTKNGVGLGTRLEIWLGVQFREVSLKPCHCSEYGHLIGHKYCQISLLLSLVPRPHTKKSKNLTLSDFRMGPGNEATCHYHCHGDY